MARACSNYCNTNGFFWAATLLFASLCLVGRVAAQEANVTEACMYEEIAIPVDLEPSDAVWDDRRQMLFIVSDEGHLLRISHDGEDTKLWVIPGGPDLEGVVRILGRERYIYLQQEEPAQLWEFDLQEEVITSVVSLPNASGMEAVAFVPHASGEGGYLYSGKQDNGEIFVYALEFSNETSVLTSARLVHSFLLPGGWPDLAALSYAYDPVAQLEKLTALHDKEYVMVEYARRPGQSDADWTISKTWSIPVRGGEGFAWASLRTTAEEEDPVPTYFFLCVDGPKKTQKHLYRYKADIMDDCYRTGL